jgi:hypothetical protein
MGHGSVVARGQPQDKLNGYDFYITRATLGQEMRRFAWSSDIMAGAGETTTRMPGGRTADVAVSEGRS